METVTLSQSSTSFRTMGVSKMSATFHRSFVPGYQALDFPDAE
jgi:hypothetical protein